jgi:predicted ATPase
MIQEITIRNYKSVHDLTMELGHVNVLIGENGCGKTNILEAVAMLGAGTPTIGINELEAKGVRVTKPSLTISSFRGIKQNNTISIDVLLSDSEQRLLSEYAPVDSNDIFSEWTEKSFQNGIGSYLDLMEEIRQGPNKDSSEIKAKLAKIEEIVGWIRNLDKGTFESATRPVILRASNFQKYVIFNLATQALRGIESESKIVPLGIYGEGLDILLGDFSKEEMAELLGFGHLISWLEKIEIDITDIRKYEGHKLGRSNSILYFRDKFMRKNNNVFAAENSNEGVLHILCYLALFISKKTPKFFAIDNIETALNPKLCRTLMKEIAALAVKHDKQVLITTHNPAVLDGINLHDDSQRLFVISRNDEGHTTARRIKMKPQVEGKELKLSEMWMRGTLGGIPTNF